MHVENGASNCYVLKMFQQGQVILKIIFRIIQQIVILMSHIKTSE